MTTYTVTIYHDDSGDLDVKVQDAGSSESDRESIAWALREAAKLVENGLPIERGMFS
jgi:predicted RNase H-like HicB family nuclease